jgi:hypothetical protein
MTIRVVLSLGSEEDEVLWVSLTVEKEEARGYTEGFDRVSDFRFREVADLANAALVGLSEA